MATLALQTVKETKNLEHFVNYVLPGDVQRTIQYVFLSELEAQQNVGAKATHILIDNGRGQLASVHKRAQAFFSNTARLVAAFRDAWDLLVKLTRVKTGKARQSYALYKNYHPVGGYGDIERVVSSIGVGDRVHIVGPGVAYGRKLFWRPAGKQRKIRKKKTSWRTKGGQRVIVYGSYTEPMHKTVKRVIARKYPDLFVSDKWIELQHGDGPKYERWPALSIGTKGSLH